MLQQLYCNMSICNCLYVCMYLFTLQLQEIFAARFGAQQGLTQPVPTRWDSVYRHIMSFLKKDRILLNGVCLEAGVDIQFSSREWELLGDLKELLEPFYTATTKTQGDKVKTQLCGFLYIPTCSKNSFPHYHKVVCLNSYHSQITFCCNPDEPVFTHT